MVAGDLVNTASRVQAVAAPGTVFVGASTRRATEQTVVYEDAGAFELKGKDGLLPLWRALRVVSGARGSLKSTGLEAPFVGRDRELRQIKDLFHTCAEERKAHLISVTGIAGIGKSRLGWEFYKYFDGLPQLTYWHRGRCLAYGDGVTYWALADMVRMRCRIVEDEEPASALEKLRSTLEEHIPDPEERRFVEPRVAQLLGLAVQEARDKQDLFAAWRLFFERLADVYPTVLAFEDMQWADASLLDFVEYLLEWSRNSPLYVITLARPELLERRTNWGAGQRNFSSLYLEPLSAGAMEELLVGLVPGLPASLREQILARAEGVPLYAVETVRMLLDRGALVQEGAVYQLIGEIGSLEVPETLHALIAARLDGLSAEERRLLQDAAVLGKTFTRDALATLAGADTEVEPLLAFLVRKEVLGVQADPRSPERGQYGFLQDLVRHVAYETLAKRDRRAKHLSAAEYLSTAFADEEDEVVEVIASHYLAAHEAVPDAEDAAEIKEKARVMLARAGQRAASLAAAAEARRYFTQAADLAANPSERAMLLGQAGEMARRAADPDAARELLEESIELYEQQGDTHAAARVLARLGDLDAFTDQRDKALASNGAGLLPSSPGTTPTRISLCSPRGSLARTGSAGISSVRPSGPSSRSTSPRPTSTPARSRWRCAGKRRSSSAVGTSRKQTRSCGMRCRWRSTTISSRTPVSVTSCSPTDDFGPTSTPKRSATSMNRSPFPGRWVTGRRSGRRWPNAPTRSSCSAAGTRLEPAARSSQPNRSSRAG